MATTPEFVEYVLDQAEGPWLLRSKKMFGEYMVYVNDKPILLVCDNQVFVKILPELDEAMKGRETGFPYEGAKEHYVLDMDDTEHVREVIGILEPITALPKPRKRKGAAKSEM
ncbi:MAG: TfoX/Sxy family protein [Propionibacteriaceae bacterium]|jgi:TfoX/Sxy family transcriptional regulator of competence genes|nr:TfoX/Sxy family protein [Propionibacteriaceae bacterium]